MNNLEESPDPSLDEQPETNSRVEKMEKRREDLRCALCPPHKKENKSFYKRNPKKKAKPRRS